MEVVKPRGQRRAEARARRYQRQAQQREQREGRGPPLAASEPPSLQAAPSPRRASVRLRFPSPAGILEAGWLLIALVVPLILWPAGRDSYELPKQTALRIILYVALGGAAVAAVYHRTRRSGADGALPAATRWRSLLAWPPLWAAAGIAAAWTLATLASVAPTVSFWGTTNRWHGLRSELSLTLLFVITAACLTRWRQLHRLAAVSAVAGVGASLYAIAQGMSVKADWVIGGTLAAERPFGTLGNPIFLADYALLAFFLSLGGLLASTGPAGRAVWGLALVFHGIALALPQSRGSWVALAAGLVLLAMQLAASRGLSWRYWLLAPAACGALLFAALLASRGLLRSIGLTRLADLVNPAEYAAQSRLYQWQAALRLWLERPLTGYGPDTFESVFEREMPLELQRLAPSEDIVYDRAHNAVLDALVSAGSLGGLALLLTGAIIAWHVWRLHRLYREEREAAQLLGLPLTATRSLLRETYLPFAAISGLVAYLIAQQFSIQTVASSSLAWMLAAALIACARRTLFESGADGDADGAFGAGADGVAHVAWTAEAIAHPSAQAHGTGVWIPITGATAILGAAALWGAITFEMRPMRARLYDEAGVALHRQQRLAEAVAHEEIATSLWPYSYRHWSELAYARRAVARPKPAPEAAPVYAAAVEAVERVRAINPVYPRVLAYYGDIAGEAAARTNDTALAERAVAAHVEATTTAPFTWRYREMAGQTFVQLGRFAEAKEQFGRAVELWDTNWALWAAYGDASILSGDRATARTAYERALRLNPTHEGVQRALAAIPPG